MQGVKFIVRWGQKPRVGYGPFRAVVTPAHSTVCKESYERTSAELRIKLHLWMLSTKFLAAYYVFDVLFLDVCERGCVVMFGQWCRSKANFDTHRLGPLLQ